MDGTIEPHHSPFRAITTENHPSGEVNSVNIATTYNICNTPLSPEAIKFIDENLIKDRTEIRANEAVIFWYSYKHTDIFKNITGVSLARYCRVNTTSFSSLLHQYRIVQREAAQPLSEMAVQWLNQLPVNQPKNTRILAKLYMENLSQIKDLNINITTFAGYYGVNAKTLRFSVDQNRKMPKNRIFTAKLFSRQRRKTVRPLTAEEISWFSSLQAARRITTINVARCCLPHLAEIKQRALLVSIARHFTLFFRSLVGTINEFKKNQRELATELSTAAQTWLNQQPITPGASIRQAVKWIMQHEDNIKALGITPSHLARQFELNYFTLKRKIGAHRTASPQDKPRRIIPTVNPERAGQSEAESQPWFQSPQLSKLNNKQPEPENAADFSTRRVITKLNAKQPVRALTVEELQWFSALRGVKKVTARNLATCCIPHLTEILAGGMLVSIASHFKIKFMTLAATVTYVRRIAKEQAAGLSEGAQQWLKRLPVPQKVSARVIAKIYLDNIVQMNNWRINPSLLGQHFRLNVFTLNRIIDRIIAAKKRTQNRSTAVAVKQEPACDHDDDVAVWFKTLLFRNMPVLMSPWDVEIALGHAQGAVREMLSQINLRSLRLAPSADFPQLLAERKLHIAANRRLRLLINAACNGTLQQLMHDEGYYQLMIDEQRPELGMGLYATRPVPAGFLLGIYPGVYYASQQEFERAAKIADGTFPVFAFESSTRRPRRKAGAIRKKPLRLNSGIGGHLQTGLLVFANTGAISADGKVLPSADNNLAAVIAGKKIITYVAIRDIAINERLLIYYGNKYRIADQRPIKLEPLESWPQLSWLAENIDSADAWLAPAFNIMPKLLALSDLFRQHQACLVITSEENVVIKTIDSVSGDDIAFSAALQSARLLAVIQHQGENHYNCWWASNGNVSFVLMANRANYCVDRNSRNMLLKIPPSGFCMTDAAAMALHAGAETSAVSPELAARYGHQLRAQIAAFILRAPAAMRSELENQIPHS